MKNQEISSGPQRNRQCQRQQEIPDPLSCNEFLHLFSGGAYRFHGGKFPRSAQNADAHGIDKIQDTHGNQHNGEKRGQL